MRIVWILLACGVVSAAPVVEPRGVRDAFARREAPITVAPGSLLEIVGSNLGQEGVWRADGKWPVQAAGVRVEINGMSAPLGEVEPGRIRLQVPYEVETGPARLVVFSGSERSGPVRLTIEPVAPALRSANARGFGTAFQTVSSNGAIQLAGTGFGAMEPPVESGAAFVARPKQPVKVYIGGITASAEIRHSATRVGEVDIIIPSLPKGAVEGDVVAVVQAGKVYSLILGTLQKPQWNVTGFELPVFGAPYGMAFPDLRGTWLALTYSTPSDCVTWDAYDLLEQKRSTLNCVGSQYIATSGVPLLAALIRRFDSGVRIVGPETPPREIRIPDQLYSIAAAAGGWIAYGGRSHLVPADESAVTTINPAPVSSLYSGAVPEEAGAAFRYRVSQIVKAAEERFFYVAADHPSQPRGGRVVEAASDGKVQRVFDLPAGVSPWISPRPTWPARSNVIRSAITLWDALSQTYWTLAEQQNPSAQRWIRLPASGEVESISFPEGWRIASCAADIFNVARPAMVLPASGRLITPITRSLELEAVCSAEGIFEVDIESRTTRTVELPGSIEAFSLGYFNEYVVAREPTPTIPGALARASRFFVVDPWRGSVSTVEPPPGERGFMPAWLPQPGTNKLLLRTLEGVDWLFDLDRGGLKRAPFAAGQLTSSYHSLTGRYWIETANLDIFADEDGTEIARVATPAGVARKQYVGSGGPGLHTNISVRAGVSADGLRSVLMYLRFP